MLKADLVLLFGFETSKAVDHICLQKENELTVFSTWLLRKNNILRSVFSK